MKIIAFVPIKLNNQRLPGKNVKSFENGKPLCYYIFQTLLTLNDVDEVFVYCSDTHIIDFIPPQIRFLQRSTSLDQDSTKINEVLTSFARDVFADIYIMAHATAPFITNTSIEKGLAAVQSGEYDSAFSAKKLQTFLWENERPLNYKLDNIPRTQDLMPIFEETNGFYIYTSDIICKQNRRIGNKPRIIEVSKIESLDIDEQIDFDIANAVFNNLLRKSFYEE
jgi:CMP-N-acetylneuraminic acid synthetase